MRDRLGDNPAPRITHETVATFFPSDPPQFYTVPFSLLGAVQNQSRDWVIDKMMVGITYDSDIERARKLIKQIGLDLQKDEEFAPLILEPLKMQGVEQFGDFAVQIRMKMMTLPGEQFVIRRKAYAMIKKAFDENGIKFAFPTVSVTGEGGRVLLKPGEPSADQGSSFYPMRYVPCTISLNLQKNIAPGEYTVHWAVVSVDTHPTEGRFTFSVKAAGR